MTTSTSYSTTWDLESLAAHPDADEFRDQFGEFRGQLEALAERSESLPPIDGQDKRAGVWVEFLGDYELLAAQARDLGALIGCHAAADAQNKSFQQWEARLTALGPRQQQIATNIELALRAASDDDFEAFVVASPALVELEFYLRDRRRNAELRLPKEQELLAADVGVDGLHAWGRLYDRLSSELRVRVMERGALVEKSVGQVTFESPERTVRENNFFAAGKAWDSIADTCADALNHIAGTRWTIYRRLGLEDHLEAPCRRNRMRRATLDVMWSVIGERKSCLLPYLQRKAESLGLDQLAWYDLMAPYPADRAGPRQSHVATSSGDRRRSSGDSNSSVISYDDACDMVIRTFGQFSSDFGQFARHSIENRWIEAENRGGKRQGGFCTSFPTLRQSRIFMTFTNSVDSMSTLAHELGHAYHSYVLRDERYFLRGYPMNLAETASTFAEAVLGQRRLAESDSAAEQLVILDGMLSDAVSFLMNIHARFLFEDSFYKERASAEVPAARLSEMMRAAQQEAYLDALAQDGWNPGFWISKLHFYITGLSFYNFPYTFGYLLSLGIFAIGAEGDEDFADRYQQFLRATGCCDAEDAVQSTLGYDLGDPEFWHKSLDIVEGRVERFVELTGS